MEQRGDSETPPHWKEEMKRTKACPPPTVEKWSKGDKCVLCPESINITHIAHIPAPFIRLLTSQAKWPLVEQMGRQKCLRVVPLARTFLGAQLGQVRQVRQAAQTQEGEKEKQAQEEGPETQTWQEEEL